MPHRCEAEVAFKRNSSANIPLELGLELELKYLLNICVERYQPLCHWALAKA